MVDMYMLGLCFAIFVIMNFLYRKKSHRNLPPGPMAIPFLGNTVLFKEKAHEKLTKMGTKYGNIFRIYFGSSLVVVLNDYKAIKEAFVNQAETYQGRPSTFVFHWFHNDGGMTFSNGRTWKEHRRFAVNTLRDFGFGNASIEDRIMVEVQTCIDIIASHKGNPFYFSICLDKAISNVICSIAFNKRFDFEDKTFDKLHSNLESIDACFRLLMPVNFIPLIRFVSKEFKSFAKAVHDLRAFLNQIIDEHLASYQPESPRDFIDVYIKRMKEEEAKNITDTTFTSHLPVMGVIRSPTPSVNDLNSPGSLENSEKENDNYYNIVILSIIMVYVVFFILFLFAKLKQKFISKQNNILMVPESGSVLSYKYLLTISTGRMSNASTDSNINIIIEGTNGNSPAFILSKTGQRIFNRGMEKTFFLLNDFNLGNITRIVLTNSFSGELKSWYVNWIIFYDIQTKVRWYFVTNMWMKPGMNNPNLKVEPATPAYLEGSAWLFWQKMPSILIDNHLWFGIFSFPTYSLFTPCQRLGCIFTYLLGLMFICLLTLDIRSSTNKDKDFIFYPFDMLMGVLGAFLLFPFSTIFVEIFRNIRLPSVPSNVLESIFRPTQNPKTMCKGTMTLPPSDDDNDTWQENMELDQNQQQYLIFEKRIQGVLQIFLPWRSEALFPWWSKYMVWFCYIILSNVVITVLTILFYNDISMHDSFRWLIAVASGMVFSMFVQEPIKIVLLCLVYFYFRSRTKAYLHMKRQPNPV